MLLRALVDAHTAIVNIRPEAAPVSDNIVLRQGFSQTIPEHWQTLVRIEYNVGVGGSSPTCPMMVLDHYAQDAIDKEWIKASPTVAVKEYMHDQRDSRNFFVVPPAVEGVELLATGALRPESPLTLDSEMTLLPEYRRAAMYFVVAAAYEIDAEYADNGQVARGFYNLFEQSIKLKSATDEALEPPSVDGPRY